MQTSNTSIQPETVTLRRGIIASTLLGMGLTVESLQCDAEQAIYTGLEKRYLIFRWAKVTKMVKLRDVDGIHESNTIHPLFLVFAFLAFVNFLVNIEILPGSWWELQLWKVPYLWVGSFIVTSFNSQGPINFIAVLFWLTLAYFFRRNFLFLDAGSQSEIRLRTDGIPPVEVTAFKKVLHDRWSMAKRCKDTETV